MNKIQIKLIAMALALTLSVSVVIMSSYAWMVLSSNPAATGIQVVIGGGNTILIAPDIKETVDGEIYHVPGRFSDKMNFGMYPESYGYLSEIGGLTPVSTSNGIDWFVTDKELDIFLEHANVTKYITANGEQTENPAIREGNYIYLDFWVVAPAGDYTLRVSTGTEDSDGGSFVIDLPEPVFETKDEITTATLAEAEGSAAAAIRIGFLANPVMLTDDTMSYYADSDYNDDRFTALRGLYKEPNTGSYYSEFDNFVIYEPNADFHPRNEELNGIYVRTKPLMLGADGAAVENPDIWNRLTVQLKSDWITVGEENSQKYIEQIFNTAFMNNPDWKGLSGQQVMSEFLQESLQGQFAQYVDKGGFIKYSSLFGAENVFDANGQVSVSKFGETSGATEDVRIIELERNIPQRIRMFIWLEGQDIDCAASANSARFAVNIEFAGGTE